MAYEAGEYRLNSGDIGKALAWWHVYYDQVGFTDLYRAEDPGARREANIAHHAFSGGAGESRQDTLWAIKLAYRWPNPGNGGDDGELHKLLEEKAREVRSRGYWNARPDLLDLRTYKFKTNYDEDDMFLLDIA